jgi:hypothetical protein
MLADDKHRLVCNKPEEIDDDTDQQKINPPQRSHESLVKAHRLYIDQAWKLFVLILSLHIFVYTMIANGSRASKILKSLLQGTLWTMELQLLRGLFHSLRHLEQVSTEIRNLNGDLLLVSPTTVPKGTALSLCFAVLALIVLTTIHLGYYISNNGSL